MTSRWKWTLLFFMSACGDLFTDASVVDPLWKLCNENPRAEECIEPLKEYCAQRPDNKELCVDSGASGGDGSANNGGDGGGSRGGDDGGDNDGGSMDGGCKDCPPSKCEENIDCAGKAGGEYCSAAKECVQCLESSQCAATEPVCAENACTGCAVKSDCSERPATPACDATSGDCVECTADDAAKCGADGKVCKADATTCVQCNVNADCKDGTKPICGSDNMCRGCTAESDCQGIGKVCREATGECVACEPKRDDPTLENCANGNACNPATFACTGKPRGTVNGCQTCISDSECFAGTRCVPTNFKGAPHGSFCLVQVGSELDACPQQTNKNRGATSVLLESGRYCFPDDSLTTCEAIKAFGNGGCGVSDAVCGAVDLSDGLCRSNKCTYACGTADDCLGSTLMDSKCIGAIGSSYCNPN